MRQELFHAGCAHIARMFTVVKHQVTPRPPQAGFFRSHASRTDVPGCALVFMVGVVTWSLVPQFPPAPEALNVSLASLVAKLGPPVGPVAADTLRQRDTELICEKPHGVAVWTLQVGWSTAPIDSVSRSRSAYRYIRVTWSNLSIPYEAVVTARVVVSNHRWSGRES
jgi:hypothetical protein